MQDNTYNLILTGQLRAGVTLADATSALAVIFKVSEEKIQQTLTKAPVSVKSNVDAATAEKFKTVIEKTGFICEIKAVNDVVASAPVPVSTPVNHAASAPAVYKPVTVPTTFKGLAYKIEGRPDYS